MTVYVDLKWDEAEPLREACVTSIVAAFRYDSFGTQRERSKTTPSTPANDAGQPNGLDRSTALALVDAGYMPLRRYYELFGDELSAPSTRLKAS
jgi:hypothetical protein